MRVPRLVTVQIGAASRRRCELPRSPLCPEELFSLVGEIADLRIGSVRFSLQDVLAVESLCRAAEYARRRGIETIVSLRTSIALDAVGEIARVRPAAIAAPLRTDDLALVDAIRRSHAVLEVETDATRGDPAALSELARTADVIGASRWRIDFSGARLAPPTATDVAEVLLNAAGTMTVIAHDFPAMPREVVRRVRAGQAVPDLRRIHHLNPADELTINACGAVSNGGDIRVQQFATICAAPLVAAAEDSASLLW